ncbi:MAG: RsbRD N-terminal domain-containing protein [Candidatus Kryptoniota bacterium]
MVDKLMDLLRREKAAIAGAWVEKLLRSYPEEGAKFFKNQKNQFANPIGHTISENLPVIFEEIIGENNQLRMKNLLRDIVRIRAVQEFTPSEAIRFVFLLKEAIHDTLQPDVFERLSTDDLHKLDAIIDKTALIAFDLYMESREKLFKLRLNEVKMRFAESFLMKNGNS